MKTMLLVAAFLSSSAFAGTIQDCFKVSNSLDRKYCMDKYLEGFKTTLNAEKAVWAKGIDPKAKASKEASLATDIQSKKDHMAIMQEEISLIQQHLETLKGAKVAKAVKEKEKKKKKDKGFRIKL